MCEYVRATETSGENSAGMWPPPSLASRSFICVSCVCVCVCVVPRRLLWPVNVSMCVVYGLCLFVQKAPRNGAWRRCTCTPVTWRLERANIKAGGVFCRLASRHLPFYRCDSLPLMPAPVLNHAFFASHASKHRTPRSRLPLHKLPSFASFEPSFELAEGLGLQSRSCRLQTTLFPLGAAPLKRR